MKSSKIESARKECLRFLEAVNKLQKHPEKDYQICGTALSGAVRRASLDLTRSLAEMRRP